MRVYRESITVTATASSFTVTATPVPPGFIRIYEGRVITNLAAGRGVMAAYLGNPANYNLIGIAQVTTAVLGNGATIGLAEEAGRRNFWEGEYWTFQVGNVNTGDTIKISLLGTEMTIFQYQKGNTY